MGARIFSHTQNTKRVLSTGIHLLVNNYKESTGAKFKVGVAIAVIKLC